MSTLYEMLLLMNRRRRKSVQGQPVASKQERAVIEVMNANIGREMETAAISKAVGLNRDTVLKVLARLSSSYDITSRITTPAIEDHRPGKHEKTKVKKWTCHSIIVPRREMK